MFERIRETLAGLSAGFKKWPEKIEEEDLHLIQERFHRRLNMEPVQVVVSPLDHELRKLLWEVRYHLEARDPFPLDLHLNEGKALGRRLEEALREQDLPSSPPTKDPMCPKCNQALQRIVVPQGRLQWRCPRCTLEEEETRK